MNESEVLEGYPLKFPFGWKRTKPNEQERSRFKVSFSHARQSLLNEIRLLGGKNPIISSNLPLRKDGIPYSNYKEPEDSGVAVYFHLNGQQNCIACDRWNKLEANLHAINLTISALRGIERWSSSEIMNAAFTGFKALPSPESKYSNFFNGVSSYEELQILYRQLALKLHPDRGGNTDEFVEMQNQYKKLLEILIRK